MLNFLGKWARSSEFSSDIPIYRGRPLAPKSPSILQSVFETVQEGLFVIEVNPQGYFFVKNNPSLVTMLGIRQASLQGLRPQDCLPPAIAEPLCSTCLGCLTHRQSKQYEMHQSEVDGGKILLITLAPVLLGESSPHHVVGACQDISLQKQSEASLKQQVKRENLLRTITQRIRESLHLPDVLQTTAEEVRTCLQVDQCLIFRCTPSGDAHPAAQSQTEEAPQRQPISIPKDWLAERYQAPRGGSPVVTNDTQTISLSPAVRQFVDHYPIRASISVPILEQNHLWGLLVVHECFAPRPWSSEEIFLLQQLADQVGIAIQQAQLYQQVQTLNAHLEDQVKERTQQLQQSLEFASLLKRITDKMHASLDEDQILQTVVLEIGNALNATYCDIALYDPSGQTCRITHEFSAVDLSLLNETIVMAESRCPDVYTQLFKGSLCQFCLLDRGGNYPSLPDTLALAIPIADDQNLVLGDIWIHRPQIDCFNEEEVRLVEQIAIQCAISMRQARLYQSSQGQVKELARINHIKDDFISTISHELRTPMSNMKMAIHMLRINLNNLEKQADYVNILEQECYRETALIDDLLNLQRLELSQQIPHWEKIVLPAWLRSLLEGFSSRILAQQQRLEVEIPDDLGDFWTDPQALSRVLMELLNNACKYTPPEERIIFRAQSQGSLLQVEISNFGTEIPAQELPRVFDKFYRVPRQDRWQQGGTGLGLALVQKTVTWLGGEINVESHSQQTTFRVKLPSPTFPQPPNN
ncbi:MAG: GAF domain-containing sensor histidine kinase [Cyanobacteriota bacterium]|nr:GAF domain-containing sensor histidine kinase [Cyanobacteriota bacterium]